MLTVGSLFAGIGGFDLGFERVGFKTIWQVEQNEFCRRVLARHFPEADRTVTDVRDAGKHNLKWVDVIAGGFPCQDISHAGLCAGINGERSGLWGEMHRIISELRPSYVVVENVSALLARGMGRVIGDLAGIGYDAEWRALSCADFGGPHGRERLFIVAYPRSQPESLRQLLHKDSPHLGEWWTEAQEWGVNRFVSEVGTEAYSRLRITWGESESHTPRLCRVDDGIPDVLDRLKGGGNAVVPQIAEWIARRILTSISESAATDFRDTTKK